MLDELMKELQEGQYHERVQAEKEQLQIAAQGQQRLFFGDSGEVKFQIHAKFYHYWGQRLGYECWNDKEFLRTFLRDNPSCRVRSHSRKIQVGYGDERPKSFFFKPLDPAKRKFRKVYGRAA